jgi:hypothetical protein
MHSIIFTKNQTQDCGDKNACYGLVSTCFKKHLIESISYDTNIYILWLAYIRSFWCSLNQFHDTNIYILWLAYIHSFWCSLLKYVGLQGPKNGESLLTFQYYSNLFHVPLDLDSYSIYTVLCISIFNPLSRNVLQCALLIFFNLSNAR